MKSTFYIVVKISTTKLLTVSKRMGIRFRNPSNCIVSLLPIALNAINWAFFSPSSLKFLCKLGHLGLEPRTCRLKAEYSTIELVTHTQNIIQ